MDKTFWKLIKDRLRKEHIQLAMPSESIAYDVDRMDYFIITNAK